MQQTSRIATVPHPPLKKKQTAADFLRSWGITEPYIIRSGYKGLRYRTPPEKGVYWYWFSKYIRARDAAAYGRCISCDKPVTEGDCGHFIPAAQCGRDLLFDERNNNLECSRCNAWDELHLIGYAKGLDRRYGAGTADALLERYYQYKNGAPVKDWNSKQYEEKIRALPNYQAYALSTLSPAKATST